MFRLNHHRYWWLLIGAISLLSVPTVAQDELTTEQSADYVIEGRAFSITDSNKLLYIERYTAPDSNNQVLVDYSTPDNSLFAQKTLDYSSGLTTPSYHLRDSRDNSENGVRVGTEEIELFITSGSKSKQTHIEIQDQQVVDAGFASVVRNHWEVLLQGESVDINFAFAAQQRNIKLTLQAAEGEQNPAYQSDADWQYFTMEVSNRFLSMFVDPIYLAFDQEKQLMRYYGRSNLADDRGKSQDVVINYQYSQE